MKLAWSYLARQDLVSLRRFSVDRWGREVALRYLSDIRDAAKQVAIEPQVAKLLKGNLRIARARSHYLIVHVDKASEVVTVARVLHIAMDIGRHLP